MPKWFWNLHCILGEGSLWDYERKRLLFVDIEKGLVFIYRPELDELSTIQLEERVGTVVPRADGKLLVALESSVALVDPETQNLEHLLEVEKEIPGNRFNGRQVRSGRALLVRLPGGG